MKFLRNNNGVDPTHFIFSVFSDYFLLSGYLFGNQATQRGIERKFTYISTREKDKEWKDILHIATELAISLLYYFTDSYFG